MSCLDLLPRIAHLNRHGHCCQDNQVCMPRKMHHFPLSPLITRLDGETLKNDERILRRKLKTLEMSLKAVIDNKGEAQTPEHKFSGTSEHS